jgi:hypothetical protein
MSLETVRTSLHDGAVVRQVQASRLPKVPAPGKYRHFKGGKYELLSVAHHSETQELLAVYRSVEDRGTIWVRPLEMFTGMVDQADAKLPRFERVSESPKVRGRVDRIAGPLLGVFRRVGGSARSTGRSVGTRVLD